MSDIETNGEKNSDVEIHRDKPVKKLVRIKRNGQGSAPAPGNTMPQQGGQQGYVPQHEAPQSEGAQQYPQGYAQHQNYVPQHEALSNPDEYVPQYEAQVPQFAVEGAGKKFHWKDALIKFIAIAASLFIIGALILNLPIINDKKNNRNVSIITFIKNWQPLAYKEGELEKTDKDYNVDTNIVHSDFTDGLDLPQKVEGQYTVLFLGFDEENLNSDVMWVCEFDIAAAKLNILQIPRDCCLPDYTSSLTGKFNSIYSQGAPDKTPIQRVVAAVEENFGIPVDCYITTGCGDIVSMVDLVGGIPMELDNEIVYEAGKVIPAGDIVLSGEQAEWFVRYRHAWLEGDIGRMQNQRRFMAAAMQKLLNIVKDEGKLKLYSYVKEVYDNEYIYTDLSLENISMLADFCSTLSMDSVYVTMVPGEEAKYNGYDVFSVHKQATLDILNEYFRPYQNEITSDQSSLIEYVTDYKHTVYDDTGDDLEDLLNSGEPKRG